jgi:uncharacterized protein (DUF433 family)
MHKSEKDLPEALSQLEEALVARADVSIRSDPDVLGGEPVYVGTRVPIANVLASKRAGFDLAQLQEAYSFLTLELVEDAETYRRIHPQVECAEWEGEDTAPTSRRRLISREVVAQTEFLTRARDAVDRGIRQGGGLTPQELLKRMDERIEAALLARKPRDL